MTRDAAPKSGYLARVQDTEFARPTLSIDGTLKATVSFQASLGGVSVVTFSVSKGGDEVALGKLAIAITDDLETG